MTRMPDPKRLVLAKPKIAWVWRLDLTVIQV